MKTLLKVFVFFILCIWLMKAFAAEEFDILKHKENFWSIIKDSNAHCLAINIYHEARSDNLAGQFAVADVVLNRVESKRFPNTVCEVVHQGPTKLSWKNDGSRTPIRNMCQFSWWCDGKDDFPYDTESWHKAQYIAHSILNADTFRGISEGATHYHATYVDPTWNKAMLAIGRIGSHVFFKE